MNGIGPEGQEPPHLDLPRIPDEISEYPLGSTMSELETQFPEKSTLELIDLQAGTITAQNNFVCDALGLTGEGRFDELRAMGPATVEQKLSEAGKRLI